MTVTGRERWCSPVKPWKGAIACLLQVWWLHVAPGVTKGDFGLPRWIMWYNIYIHNVVKHGKTMAKPMVNHPICQLFGGQLIPKPGRPDMVIRHGLLLENPPSTSNDGSSGVAMSKGPPRVWGIDPHQQCHGDLLVCVFQWKVCGWQLCRISRNVFQNDSSIEENLRYPASLL